jgi:glycosyltransferase-like protein
MTALRVAILCHSTNSRGGVVHGLELAGALVALGHEAVLHAPDPKGAGFFRPTACESIGVAARAHDGGLIDMVETRVADYLRHFEDPARRRFDVYHAQDSISGNALATLKARGLIAGFARTVHHLDDFADPALAALQMRAVVAADRHFVVSETWRRRLRDEFGLSAAIVGNGVDRKRFNPRRDGGEEALRARLGLGDDQPVLLAVGGVEERKNTLRLIEAFAGVRRRHPRARLVIAGGASLLDHDDYRGRYLEAKATLALPADAIIETGPLPDADMPRLYRLADLLVFPSTREGFGLVVLEAMASGVPAVVSRMPPFTEYLGEKDAEWCDPLSVREIESAIERAVWSPRKHALIAAGAEVAARHDWRRVAEAHFDTYARSREPLHA